MLAQTTPDTEPLVPECKHCGTEHALCTTNPPLCADCFDELVHDAFVKAYNKVMDC